MLPHRRDHGMAFGTDIPQRLQDISSEIELNDAARIEIWIEPSVRRDAARQLEQALAGSDMQPISHELLLQPPVSAWKT